MFHQKKLDRNFYSSDKRQYLKELGKNQVAVEKTPEGNLENRWPKFLVKVLKIFEMKICFQSRNIN